MYHYIDMKKRDPKKQAKLDKKARKRAQYERARKQKQKAIKNSLT
jgi:hypothetical protein